MPGLIGVFAQTGEAGITVQYSGSLLDTVKSLDPNLLCPPSQYYMMFTSGAATMKAGATLTGASSGATAQIVAVVLTQGALTGAGVGIVFVKNIVGTFTAGETVTSYCVLNTSQINCGVSGVQAKGIFVTIESNTIRANWTTGQPPTNSTATPASFGHPLTTGEWIEIVGYANAKNFQFINAVSGSTAIVNVTAKF